MASSQGRDCSAMARQCEEREAARIRKAAARHAFPKLAVDRTFRSEALFLQFGGVKSSKRTIWFL
jgi:hypothetical protein